MIAVVVLNVANVVIIVVRIFKNASVIVVIVYVRVVATLSCRDATICVHVIANAVNLSAVKIYGK